MKKTLAVTAAVLTGTLVAAIALANPTLGLAQNAAQRSASGLGQHMTTNLENSGLMPSPFSVQANAKSNNPVTMFITPNSIAEVTATSKSGKQERMFITPNSIAEVPANGTR